MFQYPNFPGIKINLHASCLNIYIPHTLCQAQKKRARVPKKKAPRSKNIQPNVSAYNNWVSPPPYGGKVHEAGAQVQKTEAELRNNQFGCRKNNSLGPAQIHAGPKKYPHKVQKTHRQVPDIFCDPRSTKKSG